MGIKNALDQTNNLFSGLTTSNVICSKCSTPVRPGQPKIAHTGLTGFAHTLPDDCINNLRGNFEAFIAYLVAPDKIDLPATGSAGAGGSGLPGGLAGADTVGGELLRRLSDADSDFSAVYPEGVMVFIVQGNYLVKARAVSFDGVKTVTAVVAGYECSNGFPIESVFLPFIPAEPVTDLAGVCASINRTFITTDGKPWNGHNGIESPFRTERAFVEREDTSL